MAFTAYQSGAGGTIGDQIAVNAPLYIGTGGHVWYVCSAAPLSADAASPAGREREKPLKTLAQAVTNAVAGDVVILMLGHAETIATGIAVNKALTIVSEGTGSSRARLTGNAATAMLTLSQTGTSLNNIYFPASLAGGAGQSRVSVTAAGIVSDNCYFECGASDTGATYSLGGAANSCQVTNAYFLATAAQPSVALQITGTPAGLFLENVTLDGGSFGFSSFALAASGGVVAIYANQIHQLNNADVQLAAGWTGVWNVGNTSGSARFEG